MYIAKRRLWILPAVAVAMLLVATALFGFSSAAYAQTVAGDYCVEGLVIDWEEEPMAGITVTLETPDGTIVTDVTDDGDDEGEFKFEAPDEPEDWAGVPGIYTATVTLPGPDWEGVTPTTISFEIRPNTDGCVKIRFKLRQIVPVTVFKIDADHNPLPNWTIDVVPGGGNLFAEPQSEETGADGSVVFSLTPGVWIFMERQPDSDDDGVRPDRTQPVVPRTGRMELDVQPLMDGDPAYILVFKNEFKDNGCISIRKFGVCEEGEENGLACSDIVDPQFAEFGYGVAGWGFTLERSDGTIARQGVTDAEGYLTFDNLPYGPYTIVEEEVPGWDFASFEALDVEVTDGACVIVPFVNEQSDSGFCIEGYKLDANGHYGIPNWEIEVDPVDDGGYDPDDDPDFEGFFTDGLGKYRIDFPANDYRIPGSEFEVCEDDDVDGWLPHTPVCQIVKLPMKPGACVQALDFVNQQVGHSESEKIKAKQEAMAEHKQDSWDGGQMGDAPKHDLAGGSKWSDGSGKGGGMYCAQYHTVKPGEGLFDIGYDYGVTPQQMVNANPDVKAPNYTIVVGQNVCIP